ncbi:hypothetical protein J2732_002554 [Achromobacter deleyi]|nr:MULTISPECIES: hypothetical protein [Achromobacter]MDR6601562.1 hypothetical protein [Achromobacter deleyi]
MANFILALVNAELSLFGVQAAEEPTAPAAVTQDTAPAFDREHYRSALG